jgi:Fe-S cluster biogenesis protein NfuA
MGARLRGSIHDLSRSRVGRRKLWLYMAKNPQEFKTEADIDRVLDMVRGGLAMHGGNVEVVDADPETGNRCRIRFQGACVGCPMSEMTFQSGNRGQVLLEMLPEVKERRAGSVRYAATRCVGVFGKAGLGQALVALRVDYFGCGFGRGRHLVHRPSFAFGASQWNLCLSL